VAIAQKTRTYDRLQTAAPGNGLLRQLCLALSNAVLQFPVAFEAQQKVLNQPTLLRNEIEAELAAMDGDFKILDYGCGSGTYTGLFPTDRYIGIDCNGSMLERAASQHPDHCFLQAANLGGISAQLQDVSQVLMIGVVHHLSDNDFLTIIADLPRTQPVNILTIDTLKCDSGLGRLVQLFERGEYLRPEVEHRRLLARVADEVMYKKVPYGNHFELAVFRGRLKRRT